MFKDASDDSKEAKKELSDLPNEIVDDDGTNDLPDEISLDDTKGKDDTGKNENCLENNDAGQCENNLDDDLENNELEGKKGGSYRDVRKTNDGETHEVHHMPADSASNLERDDGAAIKMEKEDHRQTASCGSSREAREYRENQKKLIEQGKFREALQMDIDDIHEKFGDKYDEAIAELLDYVDKLEEEGKI